MLPKTLLAAAILLLAVFLAYGEALKAYFTCDDLWHMAKLHQAFNGSPAIILESFYGPWADRKSAYLFYRPFTELTLALDYAICKGEASGYHLSNLLYHWLNGILVFVIGSILFERFTKEKQFLIPLLIALIFVLHPANAEPVVWILSRADLVSTLFYLSTIAITLKAGRDGSLKGTYPLLVLGLLSKESCATIPLLILLIQLAQRSSLRESFSRTKFHWLILIVYLSIRALALQSFTGGYIGSIGQMLNQSFLERLFIPLSLWKMFHPFNTEYFAPGNADELLLRMLYLTTGLLIILNQLYSASARRRNSLFLLCLIALTLLFSINLQVWSITDGMAGSRIAYLLFVPVAIGLVLLMVPTREAGEKNKRRAAEKVLYPFSVVLLIALCLVYTKIATANTTAWVEAGDEIRAIKESIIEKSQDLPSGKRICVTNLPVHIKGTIAFFSSDYLEGLLQPPLTKEDYSKRTFSLDGCPVQLPVLNSDLIASLRKEGLTEIVYWDGQKKRFLPVPEVKTIENRIVKVKELGFFKRLRGDEVRKLSTLFENGTPGKDMRSYLITLPAPLTISSPWLLEILIETETVEPLPFSQNKSAVLSWPSHRKLPPVFLALGKRRGEKLLRVALGDYKSWIESGSNAVNLRLDLPYKGQLLKTAHLVPTRTFRPVLLPLNSPRFSSNGLIESEGGTIDLFYDASSIEGSVRTAIELSSPYCQFEVFKESFDKNLKKPGKHALKVINISEGLKGNYRLDLNDTTAGAYHYLRLCALDRYGNILGTESYPLGVLRGSCNKRSE